MSPPTGASGATRSPPSRRRTSRLKRRGRKHFARRLPPGARAARRLSNRPRVLAPQASRRTAPLPPLDRRIRTANARSVMRRPRMATTTPVPAATRKRRPPISESCWPIRSMRICSDRASARKQRRSRRSGSIDAIASSSRTPGSTPICSATTPRSRRRSSSFCRRPTPASCRSKARRDPSSCAEPTGARVGKAARHALRSGSRPCSPPRFSRCRSRITGATRSPRAGRGCVRRSRPGADWRSAGSRHRARSRTSSSRARR